MRDLVSLLGDIFSIVGFPSVIIGYWILYKQYKQNTATGTMSMPKLKGWGIGVAFGIPTLLWLLYIASYFGFIGHSAPTLSEGNSFATTEMRQVENRQYVNETVHLDGVKFVNCTFDGVLFEYDGLAPFSMIDYTLRGHSRFRTNNAAISQTLTFLEQAQVLHMGADSSLEIDRR